MTGLTGLKGLKGISAVIATILMLVITIALAGTAYLYISGIFTTQTQGIEIIDTFCGSGGGVTMTIRNIGTNNVTSIACSQTAPAGDTCSNPNFPFAAGQSLQSGSSLTFNNVDTCSGSGARTCSFRLTPNTGRTLVADVQCT